MLIYLKKTFSAFVGGSVDRLSQTLDQEIINKLVPSTKSDPKTNVSQQQRERPVEGRTDPLRIEDPRQPFRGYPSFYGERQFPPPIGGADLGHLN